MAAPWLADGRLIAKTTLQKKPPDTLHLAWHTSSQGKCMQWFLQRLSDPNTLRGLLGENA
jgi:hypothetical protein